MQIRLFHTEGFRLSAIYAVVFVMSVLLLGAFVLIITDRAFRDQILQTSAADISAARDGFASQGIPEVQEVITRRMGAPNNSDYFLLQKDGKRLAGNLPPMSPKTGVIELPTPVSQYEILGEGAVLAPGLYVFSGSDLGRVHALHKLIQEVLLWLSGAALLLAGLGGALVSRSFLRRTDDIAKACRAIMDGDLQTRIAVRGTQDELDRLSGTINEMLDRIASLMDNLRQVTNDIAHDLRTPVAHLRNQLETAWRTAKTLADSRLALKQSMTSADELLALFTALLRIAQIEGGARKSGFTSLDLAELLHSVSNVFEPVAENAGHALAMNLQNPLIVRGDRELLFQLFSNLVENAIVHTPVNTAITVQAEANESHLIASVCDNGPGIPAEEHQKIFQRFYRREASRSTPGYGLGLSLASAIADVHGATIGASRNKKHGLCISVSFPIPR